MRTANIIEEFYYIHVDGDPTYTLRTKDQIENYLRKLFSDEITHTTEYMYFLYLGSNGELLFTHEFTSLSDKYVYVDLGAIENCLNHFKPTELLMAHNHPYIKNVEASEDDIELTNEIIKLCKNLNIKFLDHYIFGKQPIYMTTIDKYKHNINRGNLQSYFPDSVLPQF